MKARFVIAVVLYRDNVSPEGARSALHEFVLTRIDKPTTCDVCFKLLRSSSLCRT